MPLGEVKPFLPMFATAVFITENLTAYLLFTHFRATNEPFLAALSGASLFVAVMAAVQILVFPGVFSATGLLGASPQSAVWLWVLWHGGYVLWVLWALLVRQRKGKQYSPRRQTQIGAMAIIAAPLIAALLAYLAVADGGRLPPLIDGASYTRLAHSPVSVVVVLLNVLVLVACVRITRLRDALSAWLAVAVLANLADVMLTLAATARYSLGWYAARCLSMLSSSALLGVLAWQSSNLYRQIALAHNALAERSVYDALTGVFNRGHFDEQFLRDVRRAQRERTPISLLMIDIDHFKRINDCFGHRAGDECLRNVAATMRGALKRPGDYVARYGGEEFAIVLPHTDAAGALHVARELMQAVFGLNALDGSADVSDITLSVGVASCEPLGAALSADTLIERADDALYRAKRQGRNTVVVSDLA